METPASPTQTLTLQSSRGRPPVLLQPLRVLPRPWSRVRIKRPLLCSLHQTKYPAPRQHLRGRFGGDLSYTYVDGTCCGFGLLFAVFCGLNFLWVVNTCASTQTRGFALTTCSFFQLLEIWSILIGILNFFIFFATSGLALTFSGVVVEAAGTKSTLSVFFCSFAAEWPLRAGFFDALTFHLWS